MQKRRTDDVWEVKMATLLKVVEYHELSSDTEFIRKLNQGLLSPEPTRAYTPIHCEWFRGICNGFATAAMGVIIFAGLQILPSLLYRASLDGSGLIRAKIVAASLNQNILWQKIITNIQKF